ncbi:MAG: helix-turn-helix domain-containing protein [Candidatus Doudnabacteria bacterium]
MDSLKPILDKLDRLEENILKPPKHLSFKKACEYLQVSKSQLYKLTHKKKISYYKPNGKMIYFKQCDLDEYIEKYKIKTNEEIENEAINKNYFGG